MESNLSCLSSLKDDSGPVYVQPHYKETYRLAIYALLCGGQEAYEEFLRAEQISHFLSEEEVLFILASAELPALQDDESSEGNRAAEEAGPSTYFPTESDEEVPDLDLGWPEVPLEGVDTNISLLFHPPRDGTPTIKEVVRKQIQEARQVVAIAMDVFTDVDIFKEIVTATLRGVVVYILLDHCHFSSFLTMARRVGVHIPDLKNIRVRTVRGPQYRCRSGVKFYGDLEQKFILLDCRTVLHGTYSFTWSFEKINLSMVLVITGQLVGSYDEEFRRLYARSTVPAVLSAGAPPVQLLRDPAGLQSPTSSQLSLHQLHMRPRAPRGLRDDRFNGVMTRGQSVQERLHQSHCLDMGNLVRGHSYGGELQMLNSLTRLRMGTKDIGAPFPPEKPGPALLPANRLSQQHLRHRARYGADQHLIPFNSETSLHRWKMDAYFNDGEMPDSDTLSPLASPYSSHTGLNEHQAQLIHCRSRDIKLRMEELRQKRLSLQEYNNFRQSQESLRYQTLDRTKYLSPLRGLDVRQSPAESESSPLNGHGPEQNGHRDGEPKKDAAMRPLPLAEGQRSASHLHVAAAPERKTAPAYDWHEPLSRTASAAELDVKLNDPTLKLAHLQPSGLQHPRAMESLTQIPEEKEGSRVNSSESTAFKDENEDIKRDEEKPVPKENPEKTGPPAEPPRRDPVRGSPGSAGRASRAGSRERKKPASSEVQPAPKTNASTGSQHAAEAKSSQPERNQREEPQLQRRNSLRMKVKSKLSSDDKKASKKEEKQLQRRASLRSQSSSGSNQPLRADHARAPAAAQTPKRGHSPSSSRSQSSLSSQPETEKHKSPFLRLSPQRLSKKKANQAAEQDGGSRLEDEAAAAAELHYTRKEKAYSRFEYLLSTDSLPQYPAEKSRSSSLNRSESRFSSYQTQSATDNKLGRFMQRVGNLIGKNK